MTDLDTKESLSNMSDCSFIILERSSLPSSIINGTAFAEYSDKNQNTLDVSESNKSLSSRNNTSKSCNGQCISENDIQEKLKQLVRENNQLKETLSQNNLAIKSQLDTFYKWQQEILKTHEIHKEKFLETRDLILKLRAENLNLKKQLTEGFCTMGDDEDLQKNKNLDCNNLKQETEKWKSMSEDLISQNEILEMKNLKLREKLKVTEKEVFKLNSELEDIIRENKFLKQKNDELGKNLAESLSHGSLPIAEVQTQMINLLKQLEIKKNQSSQLKEKLKKVNDMIPTAQNLIMSQEMDEFSKNPDDLNLPLDCQSQRFSTLQSWVTLAEKKYDNSNQNLLGEIKELKCPISQEEKTCKQKEGDFQELKDQYVRLLEDYKELQQQLTTIQSRDSEIEKSENEKISNLSQLLKSKENELLMKQQECDQLKEDNKKLSLENQKIAISKVQLHQSDFNNEQAAGGKPAEEKEMAEQLGHLQVKPEALKNRSAEELHQEETKELKSFFGPQEVRKHTFACPKCLKQFRDLKICEKHIEECSDIDFYF